MGVLFVFSFLVSAIKVCTSLNQCFVEHTSLEKREKSTATVVLPCFSKEFIWQVTKICFTHSNVKGELVRHDINIRCRPRFFDQVGHQTTYVSMGNKHFITR